MKKKNTDFNDQVPVGYYDLIYNRKKGLQSKWHHQKFNFVRNKMGNNFTHLDYACSSGTFINSLKSK